ncbi:MAG: 50S ribosomal protein L10 [Candidatus Omnitrophota bacterium]
MQKFGILVKDYAVSRIRDYAKDASGILVLKYSGLASPELSDLRQSLRGSNAVLFVPRNNVARRALKDTKVAEIANFIEGPCSFVFIKNEPLDAVKIVYNFTKEHEPLKILGGYIDERIVDRSIIETLAKLPGKQIMRAHVVMTLNSPIVKLVLVLSANLKKLVYCLDQIKNKKK